MLPPSRMEPEPGTPNYPTAMLALSNTAPPRMQRSNWCLADYTVIEKLYKGRHSWGASQRWGVDCAYEQNMHTSMC